MSAIHLTRKSAMTVLDKPARLCLSGLVAKLQTQSIANFGIAASSDDISISEYYNKSIY